jgi:hypothetical protein
MSELQQVNLFRPELQPQKQPFRLVSIVSAWGLIVVLFTLLQLWGLYRSNDSQQQLADMKQQQIQILQQLNDLRDLTPQNNSARLENKINLARAELEQRRQLLQVMKGQNIGNSTGFSNYLIGFSRQHMSGLSLEYFNLTDGGENIELSGWTHKPELVPDYIGRLRREDSFQDTQFGELAIERVAQRRTDALRFVLGEDGEGSL